MPYLSTIECMAIKRGFEKSHSEGQAAGQLEGWIANVLDAITLEAVFD
jgi:hypothetical protein